jgi:hypothetical protein
MNKDRSSKGFSRIITGFIEKFTSGFGPLIIIALGAIVMLIFALLIQSYKKGFSLSFSPENIYNNYQLLLAYILGIVICYGSIKATEQDFLNLLSITNNFTRQRKLSILKLVLVFFAAFFVSIIIKFIATDRKEFGLISFLKMLATDEPGGFFAISMGFATLYGLYINIESLWEIKRSITSFSQLIDRVDLMAKDATPDNKIHMICNTPSLGYLSEGERCSNSLMNTLSNTDNNKRIICLEKPALQAWHNLFVERKIDMYSIDETSVSQSQADTATKRAENILRSITINSGEELNVHRLPLAFMPGFYLFFTNKSVIIVTPLFFPFPETINTFITDKEFQKKLPMVQMIGIETQDRLIYNQARKFYNFQERVADDYKIWLAKQQTQLGTNTTTPPDTIPPTT